MTAAVRLEHPANAAAFEMAAGAFLAAREAENCLMLGLTSQLRAGTPTLAATAPYFAVVRSGDDVAGAALIAGFLLVLSHPFPDAAVGLLRDDVLAGAPDVPGVIGEVSASRRFAEGWTERTGRPHRLHLSERIFRIDRVVPPRPTTGSMRLAAAADQDLLARWLGAFVEEAVHDTADPATSSRMATRWIERVGRTMYLWLDEGRPVSMVGVSGETPNGIRVAPVYTPPDLRGHGYASALTAAATQAQLDAGKRYCFLFTDLANPTSNHIYHAIGYRPVIDAADYRFDPPR